MEVLHYIQIQGTGKKKQSEKWICNLKASLLVKHPGKTKHLRTTSVETSLAETPMGWTVA